jgi:hypothetical protein
MNLSFSYKPYLSRNGTGAKQFGNEVQGKCYATGKIEVTTNNEGKEVVSAKQLYVDGNNPIKELDNVIFEGTETEVKAIGYFYRNGVVDIKVVYL